MLDANDIQTLREMFREEGERIETRIGETIRKECNAVRQDVIDVLNMNIIPQLNRFDARITRLERLQSQS